MAIVFTAMLIVSELRPVRAQTAPSQKSLQKEAATIYNLCKFIHWPDSLADNVADFKICVPAGSILYKELRTFEDRSVGGHPVRAIEIRAWEDEIQQCRVLFLAKTDSVALDGTVDKMLTRTAQYPLLTISDIDGFTGQDGMIEDGMIELIQAGERVRFIINVNAARHAGLKIAAPLLSIAATVGQPVSGGE